MIELKTFCKDDCPQLIEWVPDERFLLQWAGPNYSWPLDLKQLHATLERTCGHRPSHYMFRATDTDTGQPVGHIELVHVDYEKRTGHVGRVLVGQLETRGQGYGKHILSELIVFAFGTLDLRELTLGVFDFNEPAINCYRSLGFQQTEFKKDAQQFGDECWSTILMQIDREDWKAQDGRMPTPSCTLLANARA